MQVFYTHIRYIQPTKKQNLKILNVDQRKEQTEKFCQQNPARSKEEQLQDISISISTSIQAIHSIAAAATWIAR